jgi:hypothetical protein
LLGPPDNTFEPPKGDTSQRQVTTDKILEVDEFVDANEHSSNELTDADAEN